MAGEEGRGREGMGGKEREGKEEGTGRGPQFKKNDPPSSDGWLWAWEGDGTKYNPMHAFLRLCIAYGDHPIWICYSRT